MCWIALKLSKKCAEKRLFFKNFIAETLQNNALKCAKMRLKFVRNALKCVYLSKNLGKNLKKHCAEMCWNALLELCKKCDEMHLLFKKFSAETLLNNAPICAELHWNFLRNALIFQNWSAKTLKKIALKCVGTLQEMRWNALIFQNFQRKTLHKIALKCVKMSRYFLWNALK